MSFRRILLNSWNSDLFTQIKVSWKFIYLFRNFIFFNSISKQIFLNSV